MGGRVVLEYEIAEWLRLQTKRSGRVPFPVIALTGVTSDEDTRRIEESGVSAVLQKPVNVGLLFEALRNCRTAASAIIS